MRCLAVAALLLLGACGRPLSPGEAAFAERIHGDTLDVTRVRLVDGALIGKTTYPRQTRPRRTCRERILPEPKGETITVSPAGFVLFNRVYFAHDWYARDYLPRYPEGVSLVHAMLFAHEMTHVWQWQNRARTGYSPWRAAREHRGGADPYLFDIDTRTAFTDYGFEKQASIVEEYVCCAMLDPQAPRTQRLQSLLGTAFPVQKLVPPERIALPWDGAKTEGICR